MSAAAVIPAPRERVGRKIMLTLKHYLAGVVKGDGYISTRSKDYEVKITDRNRDYIETLKKLVEEACGLTPKIIKEENSWRLRIYRKEIHQELTYLVKTLSMKPDNYFITGLIDAEGDYNSKKRRLRITNKDLELLLNIHQYLENHRIASCIYRRKRTCHIWYALEIYGYMNIRTMLNLIRPIHPRFKSLYIDFLPTLRGWSGRLLGLKRP